MSGNNTPTPIALQIAAQPTEQNGFATLYIEITNSDGSAPTLALEEFNPSIVNLTQPTENPGSDDAYPVAQYPWVAVIAATGTGNCAVDLVSDGIVNQTFDVTITGAAPQTAYVPPGAIVITPPT